MRKQKQQLEERPADRPDPWPVEVEAEHAPPGEKERTPERLSYEKIEHRREQVENYRP